MPLCLHFCSFYWVGPFPTLSTCEVIDPVSLLWLLKASYGQSTVTHCYGAVAVLLRGL